MSSVTESVHADIAHTMTLGSGLRVTTYHPPKDFDLARATDEDLARVGLPARPTDPHQKARYDRVLAQLHGKFNYIPATLRHNPDVTHGPRRTAAAAGTETSSNDRRQVQRYTGVGT